MLFRSAAPAASFLPTAVEPVKVILRTVGLVTNSSPIGAGSAAITSAIADALGGRCLCRTPLTTDVILAALEGREPPHPLLQVHA